MPIVLRNMAYISRSVWANILGCSEEGHLILVYTCLLYVSHFIIWMISNCICVFHTHTIIFYVMYNHYYNNFDCLLFEECKVLCLTLQQDRQSAKSECNCKRVIGLLPVPTKCQFEIPYYSIYSTCALLNFPLSLHKGIHACIVVTNNV